VNARSTVLAPLDVELDRLYVEHVTDLERRYAAVLEAEGWDAVVLHAGSLVKRSAFDDQHWPLRPVPHWQHWLPLAEPDGALIVRAGQRPVLCVPAARSFWERPAPPPTLAFLDVFDVVHLEDPADAKDHLHGSGGRGEAQRSGSRIAFVGEDRARAASWGLAVDAVCPPALTAALDQLRVQKTPYEVACLAEANRRARAGHEALRVAFRDRDASELDLHLLYLGATAQDDWETPYKNIVALDENAATLHHVAYGRRSEPREAASLLVDAGAACRGYGADITRTWVKGTGAAASAFAHLVAGVDAMQAGLCAAIRAGTSYEDLHDESHRQAAAVLRDVGILRGTPDAAVAGGVTRAFYPHGLGHSLGLQTHDVGCALRAPRPGNAFLRNTRDIAVGQLFTIEPGIYFIDELLAPLRAGPDASLVDWNTVEALAPLGGVRIEDDVFVASASGPVRNLTREHLERGGGSP
jgi:Xaa-Pro dipeptidase